MEARKVTVSRTELIAILAMTSATVAFSTDAMLPAFPQIAADLSPLDPNKAQLVIASFMIGLGVGTLFSGPISDAFGRQFVALWGTVIIVITALIAANASNLEILLVARFFQGIGSAGPRIAALAIVRDLFNGREMARILSFVIFVFSLAPIFAPSIGWALAWGFGWRSIFFSFAVFTILSTFWLRSRLPETLALEHRRPFRLATLAMGFREIIRNRQVLLAMLAQMLVMSTLLAGIMSSQQVFDEVFGQGRWFPLLFALMAVLAACSNLINAAIVVHLGMRRVVLRALLVQGGLTGLFFVVLYFAWLPEWWVFPIGFIWYTSIFYLAGFGIGNLNAIAMEPLGHMAGMVASVLSATATVASILIAAPIGQAFDGTLIPLTASLFALAGMAALIVVQLDES